MFAQHKAVVGDQVHVVSPEACTLPIFPSVPEVTQLIGRKEIAALWELLKLASFRASSSSSEEAVTTLSGLLQSQSSISINLCYLFNQSAYSVAVFTKDLTLGEVIAEICVTELEEISGETDGTPYYNSAGIGMGLLGLPQPVVQESSHPYTDDVTLTGIFLQIDNLVLLLKLILLFSHRTRRLARSRITPCRIRPPLLHRETTRSSHVVRRNGKSVGHSFRPRVGRLVARSASPR